jgi:hypothetical protein
MERSTPVLEIVLNAPPPMHLFLHSLQVNRPIMLCFRFCVALYTASHDGQLKYTRISLASGMRLDPLVRNQGQLDAAPKTE